MGMFPIMVIRGLSTPPALTLRRSGSTGLNGRHLPPLLTPEMMLSDSYDFSQTWFYHLQNKGLD